MKLKNWHSLQVRRDKWWNPSIIGVYVDFQGPNFYVYNSKKPRELDGPYSISAIFSRDLSYVDAAFVWSGNGQIYFVQGRYR